MTKKDKNFLIFASLGALSLSILAIASNEGQGFLATDTPTYQCADITFGTAEYSSTGKVTTDRFSVTNIALNSSAPLTTSTNCYADPANETTSHKSAARIGGSGTAGTLTFAFASSYQIVDAWAYCYRFGKDSTKDATLSLSTSALSADSFKSVSATEVPAITSTNPSDLPSVLHWTGLDGGSGASSTTLTVKSTSTARVNLCKIVLKIVTGYTPAEKSLSNISVTTQPTKSSYTINETLDTTGLVITADYGDNSSADVTSSCTLSPANGTQLTTVGSQTVNVSYTYSGVTKTASFNVTVTSASVTLDSIAVTTEPDQMTYTVGDTLDTNGIVVTASYSDTTTADVTSSCSFSPTTLSTAGSQTITVSYSGLTAEFSVTVNAAKTLTGLSSSGNLTTTSYTAGQSFNPAGLTITATYSGGSTANVTSSVTWGTLSQGDTSVTGSYTYGGVTMTVNITGITVSAASGTTYMYTKQSGDHLQVFALEQTGTYGDCTLFKYGNWEMLIDGGNTTSQTQLADLMNAHVTDHTLDLLVLTHPHTDHYGGFYGSTTSAANGGTLVDGGVTSVTNIVDDGLDSYGSGYISNWVNGVRSHFVSAGGTYSSISSIVSNHKYDAIWHITPDIYIQWLDSGTYATQDSTSANNNSICLDAHFGTYEYVMVGDAQNTEVNSLMSNYSGTNKFITSSDTVIFKACHHCSGTADSGNTTTFLNYVAPTYGWASSGIVSANAASKVNTPATSQHPYKNGAATIVSHTTTSNFYWNGTAGTLDMTLTEAFGGFTIAGEGRKYGYGYKMSGTLVDANSEKTTPLYSTQWATTSAFAVGGGGTL